MIPGFAIIHGQQIPDISYVTKVGNSVGASSLSFTNVSLGAPAPDRRIICAVHLRQSSLVSAVIAGVPATIHASAADINNFDSTIISALVPSGTSGTITLEKNNGSEGVDIGIFRMTAAAASPFDTDTQVSVTPDTTASLSFTTAQAAGVAVLCVLGSANIAWTGATESYDVTGSGSGYKVSAAIVTLSNVVASKSQSQRDAISGAVWEN